MSINSETVAREALKKARRGLGREAESLVLSSSDSQSGERAIQKARLATVAQFASQVAHEIRNPLNSISLNLELLEDELQSSGEEARALIRSVLGELDRLNAVVTKYLECARLPKTTLKRGKVESVIQRFAAGCKVPLRIDVKLKLSTETPEILVDEGLLHRVLDNLVTNGIDALDRGGTIEIETELLDGFVAVHVSDNGEGIQQETLRHLFEPLFTTKARGTGLGLATSEQAVSEHNGYLFVESRPGKGATFSILLPI